MAPGHIRPRHRAAVPLTVPVATRRGLELEAAAVSRPQGTAARARDIGSMNLSGMSLCGR